MWDNPGWMLGGSSSIISLHLIELAMHQLYSVRDFGLMYLFSHALRNATSALHRCAFLGAVVRSVGASHSLFPLFVMWL